MIVHATHFPWTDYERQVKRTIALAFGGAYRLKTLPRYREFGARGEKSAVFREVRVAGVPTKWRIAVIVSCLLVDRADIRRDCREEREESCGFDW